MSDIEELELIAEANAFGFRCVAITPTGRHHQGGRPPQPTCDKGHPRNNKTTRYRKYKNRPGIRRTCRVCDAIRESKRRAERNANRMPTALEAQ